MKTKALKVLECFLDTMQAVNGGDKDITDREFKIFVGGVLSAGLVLGGEKIGEELASAVVQEMNMALGDLKK